MQEVWGWPGCFEGVQCTLEKDPWYRATAVERRRGATKRLKRWAGGDVGNVHVGHNRARPACCFVVLVCRSLECPCDRAPLLCGSLTKCTCRIANNCSVITAALPVSAGVPREHPTTCTDLATLRCHHHVVPSTVRTNGAYVRVLFAHLTANSLRRGLLIVVSTSRSSRVSCCLSFILVRWSDLQTVHN